MENNLQIVYLLLQQEIADPAYNFLWKTTLNYKVSRSPLKTFSSSTDNVLLQETSFSFFFF